MQSGTPPTQPEPRDSGFALILKIVLVLSMVALVASVSRLFRKKSPEVQQAVPEPEETPRAVPERRPMVRREATPSRPVSASQPRSAAPTPAQATSNLWASVASPPAESGYWMASRLPELRPGAEGIGLRFEPPVFYRVPLKYGEELSNSLAAIRSETNVLKQFEMEFAAVFNGADRDHQDYVRTAKAANAQRRAEAGALLQKLTDMQALYLERKREFQQEHARLKPQPVHRVEYAPVHGLQAIAHIGQSAPDDDAHRVIKIRPLHLIFDIYRDVILGVLALGKSRFRVVAARIFAARALWVFRIVCQATILAFWRLFIRV